ncbi:MAG: cytochrome c-type biogenesis protein CcmH [Dehalococcoidia bacterium]
MTGLPARPRTALTLAAAGAIAAFAIAAVALVAPREASAQLPATEEQAMQVERQLLCPICTNERLDVCSTAICQDMKRIIRERLAAGSSPDDIILYFETRYGPKVRAELEPQGFNLWLYGWIGASTLAVAALGGWFLLGLRRRAQPSPAPNAEPPSDDEWLDAQIADSDDR